MLAFTRARKRSASALDAPSTPVKAQRSMAPIVDNAEFHDGLAAVSPPVTPIKGTPVRVDPVIKVRVVRSCAICARLSEASGRIARAIVVLWEAFLGWTSAWTDVGVRDRTQSVYRYIDKKTYLDWGLTSDWLVEGPRKRRSIGCEGSETPEAKSAEASPIKKAKTETPGEEENAASEGYGEMTEGSIERLLQLLQELSTADLDSPLPLRTPVKGQPAWASNGLDLCEESSFVDIGSGYGKVVFHAALSAKVSKSLGIEYVPSRATKALEVQADLLDGSRAFMTEESVELMSPPRCVLEQGDATTYGAFKFSHIYMYDRVFNEKTIELLAKQLNKSKFKVMVTYQRVELWKRLGLRNVAHVHSFTMRTTGGQNFKAYILVKET